MDYDWPGNVRELENAIEHAFVKCHSDTLTEADLPRHLVREVRGDGETVVNPPSDRDRLTSVLEQTGWNRSRAARILGMHRTTVWRKMKEYGIEAPAYD
jgi:transcriptional regulator of acetoin/glycerol metabolism